MKFSPAHRELCFELCLKRGDLISKNGDLRAHRKSLLLRLAISLGVILPTECFIRRLLHQEQVGKRVRELPSLVIAVPSAFLTLAQPVPVTKPIFAFRG